MHTYIKHLAYQAVMNTHLTSPHKGSLAPSRHRSDLAMTNFSTGIDLPAIRCLYGGIALLIKYF